MTAVLPSRAASGIPQPATQTLMTITESAQEAWSEYGQYPGLDTAWLDTYAPDSTTTIRELLDSQAIALLDPLLRAEWLTHGYRVRIVPAAEFTRRTMLDNHAPGDETGLWEKVRAAAVTRIDIGDVIDRTGLADAYATAHGIPTRPRHMTQPPRSTDPAAQCPCRPTTDICGCPGTTLGNCRCYRIRSAS